MWEFVRLEAKVALGTPKPSVVFDPAVAISDTDAVLAEGMGG